MESEEKAMAKTRFFYWFTFADGYTVGVRGLSKSELAHLEKAHGKLVDKSMAG
jgi:hypothetical protein